MYRIDKYSDLPKMMREALESDDKLWINPLMTQFTSFVAVEEKIVNKDGKPVRVELPVGLPKGVSKLAIQEV